MSDSPNKPVHEITHRSVSAAIFARTNVRDPADADNEGTRRIECRGAHAEYTIAGIVSGFAVRLDVAYHTGTMAGRSTPWTRFDTREECVEHFLATARRHFDDDFEASDVPDSQRRARDDMQKLLAGGGLFGFLEPDPVLGEE